MRWLECANSKSLDGTAQRVKRFDRKQVRSRQHGWKHFVCHDEVQHAGLMDQRSVTVLIVVVKERRITLGHNIWPHEKDLEEDLVRTHGAPEKGAVRLMRG